MWEQRFRSIQNRIRAYCRPQRVTAITETGAGTNEAIVFRGDKDVKYGIAARVLGRLNEAGFRNVLLLTEVEQGA